MEWKRLKEGTLRQSGTAWELLQGTFRCCKSPPGMLHHLLAGTEPADACSSMLACTVTRPAWLMNVNLCVMAECIFPRRCTGHSQLADITSSSQPRPSVTAASGQHAEHAGTCRTPCYGRVYDALPQESRTARVQILRPTNQAEASSCVLHLAATGEHSFKHRLQLGEPLLAQVSCPVIPLI